MSEKGASTPAVVDVEVVEAEVVALPTPEHKEHVREEILRIRDMLESSYVILGRLLYEAHEAEYWKEWGYRSFNDYVERELCIKRRRAYYFLSLFSTFIVGLGRKEEELTKMGWSKAALIKGIVTPDTADQWIAHAVETSYGSLNNEVKEVTRRRDASKGEGEELAPIVPLLGVDRYETELFPLYPQQHNNVMRALEEAKKTARSNERGHLLDCIALEFLSSHAIPATDKEEIQWWIHQIKGRFPDSEVVVFKTKEDLAGKIKKLLAQLEGKG